MKIAMNPIGTDLSNLFRLAVSSQEIMPGIARLHNETTRDRSRSYTNDDHGSTLGAREQTKISFCHRGNFNRPLWRNIMLGSTSVILLGLLPPFQHIFQFNVLRVAAVRSLSHGLSVLKASVAETGRAGEGDQYKDSKAEKKQQKKGESGHGGSG
ncbi:hypothetical protein SMMN14_06868 [Sphaerulina musiva]